MRMQSVPFSQRCNFSLLTFCIPPSAGLGVTWPAKKRPKKVIAAEEGAEGGGEGPGDTQGDIPPNVSTASAAGELKFTLPLPYTACAHRHAFGPPLLACDTCASLRPCPP